VLEHQLLEYLQNWLADDPDRPLDLTPEAVIHGQLHGWLERFTITVGGLQGDDWVDELRAARERGAENIAAIHEGWRNMQPFDFDAVYRRELRSFGAGTLEQHVCAIQQHARVLAGDEPCDLNALLPSSSTSLVLSIHHFMREAGIADAELWPMTARFFRSGKLENGSLGYLDDLRDAVPDQHVALVREVCSDSWLEPFTGVFDEHDNE
jgi:hypothetical protein